MLITPTGSAQIQRGSQGFTLRPTEKGPSVGAPGLHPTDEDMSVGTLGLGLSSGARCADWMVRFGQGPRGLCGRKASTRLA